MAEQHDSSDDSSDDESLGPGNQGVQGLVRRARRRKSIEYAAGSFDSELARKFSLAVEDMMSEKQCATELEGKEIR